jgi:glutamyl/glutaminyl-tRNA synthetase
VGEDREARVTEPIVSQQPVRTRFAPSPTGHLHVGGARTALFNYLLARQAGGHFILRMEDTDQTRHLADADRQLLEDLRWLDLRWDEGPGVGPFGPYYQSQRLETYRLHARRLLEAGQAYYAFDTRAELEAMRAAAAREKRTFRYPRPTSFPSETRAEAMRAAGRPAVVRFKMPEHDYVVHDTILGDVRIAADEVDDFVILKADGWPTYHFAVVVDDELMQITHVLRGQEHLMNTPNHLGLQEALGCRTPVYAHLPIILTMSGSKMGKREKDKSVRAALEAALRSGVAGERQAAEWAGADAETFAAWRAGKTQLESPALAMLAQRLGVVLPEIQVHDFRASGYLPEVLINFLALLGWSPGDNREKFTLPELCEAFRIERVGKTNARFDREKLLNFNTVALAAATPQRKLAALRDYLSSNRPGPLSSLDDATLARLLDMNPTARVLRDVDQKTRMLFVPDEALVYDPQAVGKTLLRGEPPGTEVLAELRPRLAAQDDWSAAGLEALIRGFAESRGLTLGKVAQPLRVAVTGAAVSPPIFDTLSLIGKTPTLARVDRAMRETEAMR